LGLDTPLLIDPWDSVPNPGSGAAHCRTYTFWQPQGRLCPRPPQMVPLAMPLLVLVVLVTHADASGDGSCTAGELFGSLGKRSRSTCPIHHVLAEDDYIGGLSLLQREHTSAATATAAARFAPTAAAAVVGQASPAQRGTRPFGGTSSVPTTAARTAEWKVSNHEELHLSQTSALTSDSLEVANTLSTAGLEGERMHRANERLQGEIAALRGSDARLLKEASKARATSDALKQQDDRLSTDGVQLTAEAAELRGLNEQLSRSLVQARRQVPRTHGEDALLATSAVSSSRAGMLDGRSTRKGARTHDLVGALAIAGVALTFMLFIGFKAWEFVNDIEDEDGDGDVDVKVALVADRRALLNFSRCRPQVAATILLRTFARCDPGCLEIHGRGGRRFVLAHRSRHRTIHREAVVALRFLLVLGLGVDRDSRARDFRGGRCDAEKVDAGNPRSAAILHARCEHGHQTGLPSGSG